MVDADLHGVGDLAELKRSTLVRVVGALVSLAMSRRVVTPLLLGSDTERPREENSNSPIGSPNAMMLLLVYFSVVAGFAVDDHLFKVGQYPFRS